MGVAHVYQPRQIRKSNSVVGQPHGLADFVRKHPGDVLKALAEGRPAEGSHDWAKNIASQCGLDAASFDAAIHLLENTK